MIITVENHAIELDNEGYLIHLQDWTPTVADSLAQLENITLTQQHWEIIHLLRQFYDQYQLAPANRALIKYLSQHLNTEKANSIYLNFLFNGSPAKLAAKLAGLPKPTNCL